MCVCVCIHRMRSTVGSMLILCGLVSLVRRNTVVHKPVTNRTTAVYIRPRSHPTLSFCLATADGASTCCRGCCCLATVGNRGPTGAEDCPGDLFPELLKCARTPAPARTGRTQTDGNRLRRKHSISDVTVVMETYEQGYRTGTILGCFFFIFLPHSSPSLPLCLHVSPSLLSDGAAVSFLADD